MHRLTRARVAPFARFAPFAPSAHLDAWVCAAVLALAIGWHVKGLLHWLPLSPFDFDAKVFYIPYARRLLTEGWSFFLSVDALKVPPFSYAFPALFGADLGTQKYVGIALSALTVLLLFRSGWLCHSRLAGMLAACAYALSPLPLPFMASGSVEPQFVFLLALWCWALAEAMHRERRVWFVVAGVAFGLAALTRATLVYFIPLLLLAIATALLLRRGPIRLWRGLALGHLIACFIVAPVFLFNLLQYGLPAISTGAGVAFYNGHHALTWGFDPGYFNTPFDFGILTRDGAGHLDLDADRVLLATGKKLVGAYDLLFLLKLYAIKLTSFLFLTNLEWIAPVDALRSTRIVLIVLALAAFGVVRKNLLLAIISAVLLFQIAVHIPVIYSLRYSVVAMELPLALLAGVGTAALLRQGRWQRIAAVLGIMTICVLIGQNFSRSANPLQMNLDGVAHYVVEERTRQTLGIRATDGAVEYAPGRFRSTAAVAEFDIDFHNADFTAPQPSVIAIDGAVDIATNQPSACYSVMVYGEHNTPFVDGNTVAMRWSTDGHNARVYAGAASHLRLDRPGVLRLRYHCGANAAIDIDRIAVIAPLFSLDVYRTFMRDRGVLKSD